MKILKTLFLCAILITLSSCESDDDSSTTEASSITGAWNMVGFEYSGNYTFNGTEEITTTGIGQDFTTVFTFNENPNNIDIEGNFLIELVTMFGGQTITEIIDSQSIGDPINENDILTWSLNGNEFTIDNGPDDIQIFTIITLNSTSLVFNYSNTIIEAGENGNTEITELDVTYRFSR